MELISANSVLLSLGWSAWGLAATPPEILIALVLVTLGATLQGSIGFGASVIAAPLLVLVNPVFVPGVLLGANLPLSILIAMREREHIDVQGATIVTIARACGTMPAVYLMVIAGQSTFDVLFGCCVLCMVALSAAGMKARPSPRNLIITGLFSGFSATISAVGGAPVALIYQQEPANLVRSTLSVMFTVGTFLSLVMLALFGLFTWDHLILSLLLLPGIVCGYLLSNRLTSFIDAKRLRVGVLTVSAASALVVLARVIV